MTDAAVPFFKKGKSRPASRRQRSTSPQQNESGTPSTSSSRAGPRPAAPRTSQVVLPTRKAGPNILSAGTKRRTTERDVADYLDDDDDASSRLDGPDVKWTASGSHQHAAQEIIEGDEAEALEERRAKKTRLDGEVYSDEEAPADGLYHGKAKYKSHLRKKQEVPKSMRVGPQRSTDTIKMVTLVDYQPDVCKDYKETGYCGFGDTCKFLHDRGTYLAGWQIDKQFEQQLSNRAAGAGDNSSDSDSDEDIPFACLICRKPYTDPVVTRCGHYYCSACAIKRYAKTPKCLACGTPTGGIFNRADKVIAKLRKKQEAKGDGGEGEDGKEGDGGGVKLEGLREESGGGSGGESDED